MVDGKMQMGLGSPREAIISLELRAIPTIQAIGTHRIISILWCVLQRWFEMGDVGSPYFGKLGWEGHSPNEAIILVKAWENAVVATTVGFIVLCVPIARILGICTKLRGNDWLDRADWLGEWKGTWISSSATPSLCICHSGIAAGNTAPSTPPLELISYVTSLLPDGFSRYSGYASPFLPLSQQALCHSETSWPSCYLIPCRCLYMQAVYLWEIAVIREFLILAI